MIKRIRQSFIQYCLLIIILYSSCESPQKISVWDSIDSNAIIVLESKDLPKLPGNTFISLLKQKYGLCLTSIQKLSNDDFGVVYSCFLTKNNYDSLLISNSRLTNQKINNQLFNGIEIHEIKNNQNEIQAAFTYLNGVFVLSKSSLLVENAIRVFQNKDKKGFRNINQKLFQFPSLKSDQGNVYVNFDNLSGFAFVESSSLKSIPLLNELKYLSVYDVKSDNDFLSLNGFSLGENSNLALFQKQRPVPFNVARYIPNYSNALIHFGVSDFHLFKNVIDSSFLKTFNLGNEIAFISTENSANSISAFVEFKPNASTDFDFITNYSETYSNYLIRSVNGEKLKIGFGKISPDVLFGFCTVKDNYLLLAQSIEEIKSLIDAIEIDDTWGKTLDYQKFSRKVLQESNVTLIVRKPDLFSGNDGISEFTSSLHDSVSLPLINWYSLQLSALDNNFYSSVNFSLDASIEPPTNSRNHKASFVELSSASRFAALVKNHITGSQEVLIQDSDLMVYLISLKDGVIWKRKIEAQIQESMEQLDFYKNGKLQYYFPTENSLHVIDRLGRNVANFPKSVSSQIQYSGLVDYNKSKNYRFLVSTKNNEVYLFDKIGENLSDWGPKKFEKGIAYKPEHIKIGGKDYFIVFLTDGSVHVFNRKGDRENNFYTKDKELFSGDYFLEAGISSSTTYIYYVSKEGMMTKQNLKGEILTTDNLLRGKNSKFILGRSIAGDKFYVYRIDTDKIAVFDQEGAIVFEKENNGSMNLEFQCGNTQNKEVVFSFFDVDQKFVQVFNKSGNSLINTPIESEIAPLFGFGKSNNEFGVYSFPQNSVVFNSIQ